MYSKAYLNRMARTWDDMDTMSLSERDIDYIYTAWKNSHKRDIRWFKWSQDFVDINLVGWVNLKDYY